MYLIEHKVESELMSSVQLMGQSELSTVLITVLTSRDCTRHCHMEAGLSNMVIDAGRSIGEKYKKIVAVKNCCRFYKCLVFCTTFFLP